MQGPSVTLSVVSHRQTALANQLLGDLARVAGDDIPAILTQNLEDSVAPALDGAGPRVEVVNNPRVLGFGANHNQAFRRCRTPFFCIANPDIRLASNPFPSMLRSLEDAGAGIVGPLVRNPSGGIEDSARRFPTPWSLLGKLFSPPEGPEYATDCGPLEVDWVAGMFMLFRSSAYEALGGFDESYFLYYEDVDICRRERLAGGKVVYDPSAEVIHDARRASRRDPRLTRHHLSSALRYFLGPRS